MRYDPEKIVTHRENMLDKEGIPQDQTRRAKDLEELPSS